MSKRNISSIIVGKDGSGIITERDLVRKVLQKGLNPKKLKAKDIMSSALVTALPDDYMPSSTTLMNKHKIRHLVVKNKAGEVKGVITQTDLVRQAEKLMSSSFLSDKVQMVQLLSIFIIAIVVTIIIVVKLK